MRFRVTLVLLSCLMSSSLFARVSKSSSSRAADPSYSSALAAANRFLHAWQTQDHETGIMMLTDSARQHASPEQLQSFFSPGPSAAYEITHGKRISAATYSFPVALFGSSMTATHPHVSKLVLTRSRKDDWLVDRLP